MGGPGSGRRRLPIEEHIRRGTYRANRHGPRPALVPAVPVTGTGTVVSMEPKGLEIGGRALWADLTGRYELEPGEEALLLQACRVVDILDRLEEALEGAEMIVLDDKGHSRPNPLLAELRAHRLLLVALLKPLRVAS